MEQKKTRLPSNLRSRINRLAHESGQHHAIEQRDRLMKEIEQMTAQGATFDALMAYLDKLTIE